MANENHSCTVHLTNDNHSCTVYLTNDSHYYCAVYLTVTTTSVQYIGQSQSLCAVHLTMPLLTDSAPRKGNVQRLDGARPGRLGRLRRLSRQHRGRVRGQLQGRQDQKKRGGEVARNYQGGTRDIHVFLCHINSTPQCSPLSQNRL